MRMHVAAVIMAVFFVLWLVIAGFSVLMFKNRKPGAPRFANPMLRPDLLTERGLWARKWTIILAVCGAVWLIGGGVVGLAFLRH